MKKKKKIRKKALITVFLFLLIIIGSLYLYFSSSEKLELVGKEEQTLMIGSVYQEQGTNIKDAKQEGQVNYDQAGEYEIQYHYKNQTVKRIIRVLDNKQIVMNLNGTKDTYVLKGQKYVESGCHVIDQDEGNITNQVKIKGTVDTNKVGDYEITYFVQNKKGIQCSKKRTVHVVDDYKKNITGVPVLMYHYVYTQNDTPDKLNTNYILDTKLEEQLKYLTQENYYFPSYQELHAYIKGEIDLPKKSIVLTFDDAQKGFLKYGIPLLEKYKIPATSFIIASKNGENKVKDYASEYISFQSHSYNMHRGGGNIGHGGIVSAMTTDEIKNDLLQSHQIVQNTEAFAYPYGDVTENAKQAVQQANILCAFTTQYGKVKKNDDPRILKRIRVLGESSLKSYISSIQ